MRKIFVACASALALGACDRAPEPAADSAAGPARAALSVHEAWARAADSGAMTAVYFTLANGSAVSDTLTGASTDAADEAGLHMSMQQGNTMHMAAVRALPVPAEDSVLFRPLGAHVMLMGLRRPLADGDTVPLTLRFVSGQTLEVRAGVRVP